MPATLPRPTVLAISMSLVAVSTGCSLFRGNDRDQLPRAANQTEFQQRAQELAFARRDEQIARRQGMIAREAAQEAAAAVALSDDGPSRPDDLTGLTLSPDRARTAETNDDATRELVVDGMVGQVNGKAIYADDIFEPIQAQLRALGRRLPRAQFREQATQLIAGRLQQLVTDSLIYGEAERALSENERLGLRQIVESHREELIRRFGRGSVTLANDTLIEEQQLTLNEKVEEFRQTVIVQRYLRQELLPLVNVTRRDIRRYYDDNIERFQPPQTYTLYFVRNADEAVVRSMAERITAGDQTFDQVASLPDNGFRNDQFGLFAQGLRLNDIGEGILRDTAAELDDQEVSEPFVFNNSWWLMKLDYEEVPEARELADVQVEIESQLRAQRFGAESERFRLELVRTGSYNPIDQMARDLVEIAVTRFSNPVNS